MRQKLREVKDVERPHEDVELVLPVKDAVRMDHMRMLQPQQNVQLSRQKLLHELRGRSFRVYDLAGQLRHSRSALIRLP